MAIALSSLFFPGTFSEGRDDPSVMHAGEAAVFLSLGDFRLISKLCCLCNNDFSMEERKIHVELYEREELSKLERTYTLEPLFLEEWVPLANKNQQCG